MTKKDTFSSYDTKTIKGLAIIIMFMHHLFLFPDRIVGGGFKSYTSIFGHTTLYLIGMFGKICVPIFFFLSGYGVYLQSKKKDFNILKNIKKLYLSYWKVFVIFIPIGILFFSNHAPYCDDPVIYNVFNNWEWKNIFENFFGFSHTLNPEWWFLFSFVTVLITFPFIKKIIDKHSSLANIIFVIILYYMFTSVFPSIGNINVLGNLKNSFIYRTFLLQDPFAVCFYLGMAFAKDDLIVKFKNMIVGVIKLNIFKDIVILILMVFFRFFLTSSELDILYVPLIIVVSLDIFKKIPFIEKVFNNIGNHSTNMWLIHSFYCYYFYPVAKIIKFFKYGFVSLIVLIIITYITSILLNKFWYYIGKVHQLIKDNISRVQIVVTIKKA